MKYALIVANTEYTDPSLAKLSAPGKDAESFARVLKDKDIGAFDDVKVILNQPEPVAREAIDEFFDQKKSDDLLLFYFSGHGLRDDIGTLYLAARNTNHLKLRVTGIKSDFIREAMDASRSRKQVIILDCCNSGAFAQGTKAVVGGSAGTASAFEGTGFGRIVLTASDATQFAWEGEKVIGETQNSLFTHYLVKGLEGEADLDSNGQITVDELYDYACDQISKHTSKQTPGKWSYKQHGEIVLRQFTRLEDVSLGMLPPEVEEAINDPRTFVRGSAVEQLEKLLHGKNLGVARSAHEALEKMATEDDSHTVQQSALRALKGASLQVGQKPAAEIRTHSYSSSLPPQPHQSGTTTSPTRQSDFFLKSREAITSLLKNKLVTIPAATILFLCVTIFAIIPAISRADTSSISVEPGISSLYIPPFSSGEDIYIKFSSDHVFSSNTFEARCFLKLNILWADVYFPVGFAEYTSAPGQDNLFLQLKNPGIVGEYRVDIYMDNSLVGSENFEIYPK